LKRGYVYYFDATDSSTNSHPLLLSFSSSGGNTSGEYTYGVTNSQTTNGTLISGSFGCPLDPVLRLCLSQCDGRRNRNQRLKELA
ncbi:MAG: hypothetical protein MK438_07015, partial [SAR324 cluster bacterium]|nr:hypothetical protein [SAR324 cluster bacterium]